MRTLIAIGVVALLVLGMNIGTAEAATKVQAAVGGILEEELKLELVPPADGRVGGPMTYKVTDKTIKQLQEMKEPIKVKNVDEDSATIRDTLKKLGLKDASEMKPGADYELKVVKKTIEKLKGKTVVLGSDGKVKIK